ncbi:MAG: hypothetical protein COV91_00020 [Candidatus Taylorbacteria bacterium CG11_big_fil_rev_8_21_14_0_20_46_11]|uniref:Uncharacterized protein n=1 Tax=Candidatus Taylorbacteria bacterium CG11_big_fil_rev_8_21_14_0_20_46_11 TaxID=1975025 RepID=A0A2H0KDA7_9BACT|nr:MAG: hypothetical protein COV91_00020 [Candidatus Taylorbacteria bacterium CG11_big_fil_rev_8_21_14_0_20_46_11]
MLIPDTYKVGEQISISGWYVCVPCGYKQHLNEGDVFPSCINCMRVSRPVSESEFLEAAVLGEEVDEFDEGSVAPNLELWELKRKDHNKEEKL